MVEILYIFTTDALQGVRCARSICHPNKLTTCDNALRIQSVKHKTCALNIFQICTVDNSWCWFVVLRLSFDRAQSPFIFMNGFIFFTNLRSWHGVLGLFASINRDKSVSCMSKNTLVYAVVLPTLFIKINRGAYIWGKATRENTLVLLKDGFKGDLSKSEGKI